MIGITRIYPNAMIIYVFISLACRNEGFSAVRTVVHVGVHSKDFIDILGVTENFLVIVAARGEGSLLGPTLSFIRRAENSTFIIPCFYNSIHHIGIGW